MDGTSGLYYDMGKANSDRPRTGKVRKAAAPFRLFEGGGSGRVCFLSKSRERESRGGRREDQDYRTRYDSWGQPWPGNSIYLFFWTVIKDSTE